ncbi:MAG: DUF86 domain-containing protein [Candidatus Scalindua sp. AMX11]|nr:MAG: DUF86 domain-containing protein [Candidatus Scalindua sp.]NOG85931.1 DUF86 domain-containing protein [Planctomycetota bacterium]RZV91436.1 MAG: DUF86 domain-containing protein [Candidatus Scalindua sp. SCAELEC01]TDE65996.1 MAG: DUF86 domain-containing protein [Candidatus Scalindua sp. AMX11]GJQ59305.1 MAG: DUF86 domain-containing protein [Candidatus Scalindua sp.]
MSKRENSAVIQDIKESLNRIISYTSKMEYKDFVQDYKTQDAVIRNIEILGEATKLLSDVMKNKYPDIPWKDIAGTRDKLIHDYFGVNLDIVWEIAKNEIPLLYTQINDIDC